MEKRRQKVGASGADKTEKWRLRTYIWAVLGTQCSSGQGYRRLKIVAPLDK